jgi:hypothetical protein
MAAVCRDLPILQLLLDKGAKVQMTTIDDETALHQPAQFWNDDGWTEFAGYFTYYTWWQKATTPHPHAPLNLGSNSPSGSHTATQCSFTSLLSLDFN